MHRGNKNSQRIIAVLFLIFGLLSPAFSVTAKPAKKVPSLLSYEELTTLYDERKLPAQLESKLNVLLTTPFVENSFEAQKNSLPLKSTPEFGEYLRVALWNIERGLEYEAIEAALSDMGRFVKLLDETKFPPGSPERSEILEQADALREADVIVLNEVDWGVKRSGYRNVVANLAKTLRMNYAFGVQFVELTPISLSREKKSQKKEENEVLDLIRVDSGQYKGLHGVAVLSRFPLENVRLVPFKNQPYDWYQTEKKGPSLIEKGKRKASEEIFLEKTIREVRRGGRTALYAEIADERLPEGRVTIVATHLENRSKPAGRVAQLEEVLAEIKDIKHPVILAGDMNTSGKDLRPTSIQRELAKRFGSSKFWIKRGLGYALGYGLVEDIFLGGISFGRSQGDPTVKHIPFISPNPERKFFDTLESFRFADGKAFDFRGDDERSSNGRENKLANSNQRAVKGFVTTYQVKRPFKFIGKYKLDWFFVKPANITDADKDDQPYRFAPHYGRTLFRISAAIEDRISDHHPLLIDLPLGEPRIGAVP
jgi:endonuclease/exonuclease/phosphatase family metal-dependent hydrolase